MDLSRIYLAVHGIDKNWVYAFVKRRLLPHCNIALIEWTDYRFIYVESFAKTFDLK